MHSPIHQQQEVNRGSLISYALLALPLAFAGLPIYMLAPDFYTVHLQLSLSTLGIGLFALRLLDAFIDPLLGKAIDIMSGNARLVSHTACVFLSMGFLMLFSPPQLESSYLGLWFFVSVFVVTLGFSALTILYGAVGALWSEDKGRQTLITSSREAMTLVGLILSISVPFVLMELLSARTAYLVLTSLFFVLLALTYFRYLKIQSSVLSDIEVFSPWGGTGPNAVPGENPKSTLSIIFLYFAYAVSALASAVPAVLVIFFVRDYLGSQAFVGLALVVYFLSGALSMPLWNRLAGKFGKIRAWQFSMLLAIASFTWVCALGPGDYLFYAVVCLISGIALGAEMALPPAILAEYLKSDKKQSAAQKYSGLTLISKFTLAVSAGICLPLLSYFGFQAGAENNPTAMQALLLLYGALPGVLKLLALLITQWWIYTENTGKDDAKLQNYSTARSMPDG